MSKQQGVIKWFNSKKGYGFIVNEGKDIFVHVSGVKVNNFKTFEPNTKVTFNTVKGKKGLQAVDVELV